MKRKPQEFSPAVFSALSYTEIPPWKYCYTMTVLQIFFIFKSEHIIGCTVKNIAQFFNGKDCDVLIFPELIEGVLVNSFVNQGVLGNVAFFHGFP